LNFFSLSLFFFFFFFCSPVRAESDESSVPVAKEVSLGKPAAYPPRTLAHPFVTGSLSLSLFLFVVCSDEVFEKANPVTAAPIALEAARDSCVVQGTLFQIETMDKPLYDYALPFDDMIPINTYVGDWEEL
jgi:hypothetical protein